MGINELRKQQIYAIIENPTLTKNQKECELVKILNKTNEEIIMDSKSKKSSLEDIYQSLFFRHELEGEIHETQKNK